MWARMSRHDRDRMWRSLARGLQLQLHAQCCIEEATLLRLAVGAVARAPATGRRFFWLDLEACLFDTRDLTYSVATM